MMMESVVVGFDLVWFGRLVVCSFLLGGWLDEGCESEKLN